MEQAAHRAVGEVAGRAADLRRGVRARVAARRRSSVVIASLSQAAARWPRRNSAPSLDRRPSRRASSITSRPSAVASASRPSCSTRLPGASPGRPAATDAARTATRPRSVSTNEPGHGSWARTCRSSSRAGRAGSSRPSSRRNGRVTVRRRSPARVPSSRAIEPAARRSSASRSAPSAAARASSPGARSVPSSGHARAATIGPVSMPSSMRMIVTPASASPAAIVAGIGVAPRWRGSSDGCRLRIPCGGRSRSAPRDDLAVVGEHAEVRSQRRDLGDGLRARGPSRAAAAARPAHALERRPASA